MKSQKWLGSGMLSRRWYLQMCHRQMRHGDERGEIWWMGYFALLLIMYVYIYICIHVRVSPFSLSLYIYIYISLSLSLPFCALAAFMYLSFSSFRRHVWGNISSAQEFLFPGAWLFWWQAQGWWQAQRHQIRQVQRIPEACTRLHANFGEAWRSLAKFGDPHWPYEAQFCGKIDRGGLVVRPVWVLSKDEMGL